MEASLLESVKASLSIYMYRNATFLCERLYASFPSEANLQLLATCYYRNNQAYRAYHLLKGSKSAQCRYLFSLACFEMGSMAEAEAALLPPGDHMAEVPNGAAGHYMLGLICRLTDRRQAAIEHYTQALSLDPFFWSAYEDLCLLGVEEDVDTFFGDSAFVRLQQLLKQKQDQQKPSLAVQEESNDVSTGTISWSPKQSKVVTKQPAASGSAVPASPFLYSTPSPSNSQAPATMPPTPVRNAQAAPSAGHADLILRTAHPQRRKFLDEGKLRKVSGRLFAEPQPRRSLRLSSDAPVYTPLNSTTRPMGAMTSSAKVSSEDVLNMAESPEFTVGDESAPLVSSVRDEDPGATSLPGSKLLEGYVKVLTLLKALGEGFKRLCMYESQEALEAFAKLPKEQFETGWVLCQVGRSYFEMVDYTEAERAFSRARRLSPYSLEGSDIYSTVLYHMKKEVELSYLAQEAVSMDRLSPQAWCVIGNCFSLQKDHETALKHFQRALQLDSHFTYAHTLCGHEYVAMEDFEEGLACYRNAIRMDARHYNAWYGLGTIYFRQEKYELAEYHFRRALEINGRSSVLHCYLGMALHALKKNKEAVELLSRAIRADPKNPLPKYQKANVFMSEERYQEALEVLEQLREVAPRESSVYFLLGKVFKRLGQAERAMYHFCVALDLKPSTADVNLIKAAIEKLHVPDELEEENL